MIKSRSRFSLDTFSIHSVIGVCISFIYALSIAIPINIDTMLFVIEFILYKLFAHSVFYNTQLLIPLLDKQEMYLLFSFQIYFLAA